MSGGGGQKVAHLGETRFELDRLGGIANGIAVCFRLQIALHTEVVVSP